MSLIYEFSHERSHVFLKRAATRYDNSNRYGAVGVQSFEVFEVAIEERVFIIPFNFKRNSAGREFPNVIDFM